MKKLLLIGTNTVHTYNYLELVRDYFDAVLLITNEKSKDIDVTTEIVDFSLAFKNVFKTPKQIKKIITEFEPTVIHVHQANSVAFYLFRATKNIKIPKILTVWGSDILINPQKSFLLKKMVQYNLNKANYITTDSLYVANEVRKLTPKKDVSLVANFGVSLLPVNCEKENIIYSNRLHKNLYQIDKIIDSFSLFLIDNPDWKLVVAGTGNETENLKRQVEKLNIIDHVSFVGWVNEQENAQWYGKSKIWVSIPYSDGVGISMLEAMYYGCVPIVLDLPVKHEWIENGVNGVLVTNVDEEFISKGLLIDPKKAYLKNKEIIEERATKKVNKEKFIHFYNQILSNDKSLSPE